MTTNHPTERILDLLADRSTQGLDAHEEAELTALLAEGQSPDDAAFDLAAAQIHLAALSTGDEGFEHLEAMPPALRDAILASAPGAASDAPAGSTQARLAAPTATAPKAPKATLADAGPRTAQPDRARRPPQPARSWLSGAAPWLAAAACLVLVVGAVVYRGLDPAVRVARPVLIVPTAEATSTASERAAFLASTPDAVVLPLTATADPAAAGTKGDIVFSPSTQRGYMRFVGLAPNDPKVSQYQLWIFDEERDERYPVDGGVFDIGPGGEVVVPITPRVRVGKAKLFAVTVEKPGGVVVSKRERIVTTAAASG